MSPGIPSLRRDLLRLAAAVDSDLLFYRMCGSAVVQCSAISIPPVPHISARERWLRLARLSAERSARRHRAALLIQSAWRCHRRNVLPPPAPLLALSPRDLQETEWTALAALADRLLARLADAVLGTAVGSSESYESLQSSSEL